MKPSVWHSSVITIAPYFSASSTILRVATVPSMLNAPSVTTSFCGQPVGRRLQAALEVGHVVRLVPPALRLASRMPSMIEAWFSSSLITASASPSSGSNTPPFASKQAA